MLLLLFFLDVYERDITKWIKEDNDFLETHNFPAMLEQVRNQPYVTFVGVPGSGKTATVRHIALILQKEGYEILPTVDKNKIEDYCDPQNPQVSFHSAENALNEKDKYDLLAIYRIDKSPFTYDKQTLTSKMFPFLCNFFSKKKTN